MIRISTGILAIILLAVGAFLYLFQPTADPFIVGMMIRVGALLAVIWLAFPQLETLKGRMPVIMIALGILCIAVLAARPNIGKVLIALVTIGIGVGGALKWMTKIADGAPPPKK